VRHRITHHAIEVEIWEASGVRGRLRGGGRWVDPADPAIAWTAMARRVARALERDAAEAAPALRARRRSRSMRES